MNPIDALELSWSHGRTVIAALAPTDLDRPSACAGWSVRSTLNHTLNVCEMMTRVNQGHPAEVDETLDVVGDGSNLTDLWDRYAAANIACWRESGLEGERAYRWAAFPAPVAAAINLGEVAIHAHDIARGTGIDFVIDEAHAELVHAVYSAAPLDGMRQMGELGAEIEVPVDAPVARRLLGLLGREG